MSMQPCTLRPTLNPTTPPNHRNRYPFAFLKDRYYVIARKIFSPPAAPGEGRISPTPHYGITKVVPSPVAEAFAADEMPGASAMGMWTCHEGCRFLQGWFCWQSLKRSN